MRATLYVPGKQPCELSPEGFELPDPTTGFARVTERVAQELGCAEVLVDVLDCAPDHVAYSIFDCEGETNEAAFAALANISKVPFDSSDPNHLLRGPILLIIKQ